jgi:hypothetical protein
VVVRGADTRLDVLMAPALVDFTGYQSEIEHFIRLTVWRCVYLTG